MLLFLDQGKLGRYNANLCPERCSALTSANDHIGFDTRFPKDHMYYDNIYSAENIFRKN